MSDKDKTKIVYVCFKNKYYSISLVNNKYKTGDIFSACLAPILHIKTPANLKSYPFWRYIILRNNALTISVFQASFSLNRNPSENNTRFFHFCDSPILATFSVGQF